MDNASIPTPVRHRRSLWRRLARGVVRGILLVVLLLALYLLVVLIGLIPVNNDFAPTADGVEILVASTAIHADLVLPIRNDVVDWSQHLAPRDFAAAVRGATHVAFGWGNKEFYVDTPTWGDLKAGTAFRAVFWPSATCMHVHHWERPDIPADARQTRISPEQYQRLVDHILASFQRDESGRFLLIAGGAYGANDAFYHANGDYHAFRTCNCWVGEGLKAAGVRTGWFTPLPRTVGLYLPVAQAD